MQKGRGREIRTTSGVRNMERGVRFDLCQDEERKEAASEAARIIYTKYRKGMRGGGGRRRLLWVDTRSTKMIIDRMKMACRRRAYGGCTFSLRVGGGVE